MLDAAIDSVAASGERPVVHSDRGAHYHWPGWLSRIADAKLVRSMSRKGYSPDNAACEGFFGRLKTELFYPRNWQKDGFITLPEAPGIGIELRDDVAELRAPLYRPVSMRSTTDGAPLDQ